MSLSSYAREQARAFLQPGEDIRYVFPAASVWKDTSVRASRFIVVITDASVTILSAALLNRSKPKAVWARYPRNIAIELVQMAPGPVYRLRDLVFEVDEECVDVINAANAERPPPPPSDPRSML